MSTIAVIASSAPSLINFRGELLKAMRQRGHRVYALAPSDHPRVSETAHALRALGVEFIPFTLSRRGMSPVQDFRAVSELAGILRARNVDIVLNYSALD